MNHFQSPNDELSRFVTPLISGADVQHLLAVTSNNFLSVQRYMWPQISLDFEMMSSIDYAEIINEPRLAHIISHVSLQQNKYSNQELMYLFLRSMISVVWKLDVFLATHLEQCVVANFRWNAKLIELVQSNDSVEHFQFYQLPYWLRNSSRNFYSILPEDLKEKYGAIEVVMVKANDIQSKCKSIGDFYIISLDCGMYTYLLEWCRILLHGYRIKEYCNKNDWEITEPIKTSAQLFKAIAETLNTNTPVYHLPPTALNFSTSDQLIIRDVVEHQILFVLGHEFKHILSHSHLDARDTTIELEADLFSLKNLDGVSGSSVVLNKEDHVTKLPIEKNDIQSDDPFDRSLEAVLLLFDFYEIYYYVCQKRRYISDGQLESHPAIAERRENILKIRKRDIHLPLAEYSNELLEKVKSYLDSII